MKIVIIGGVAGGATAAARLRRNAETAEIILVERGPYISFANCGLPYHVSGTIPARENLLVASEEMFRARYAVDVRSQTEAVSIDRTAKTVRLKNLVTGAVVDETYDRLLLSPGAAPVRPPLPGIESPRIFTLRNIPDLDRIMAHLGGQPMRRVVVIGGGFIGIEMAENLHARGIATTIIEGAPQILAPFDGDMAAIAHAHLKDKQVELYLGDKIAAFEDAGSHSIVVLASGRRIAADMVVLAIGVRPETALARDAGLELGDTGGIKVNAYLQTSDPDIYAVGDAVEVTQTISHRAALIPLAGPANRQGRLAADNICAASDGARKAYPGTLGTAILKVFDLAAASTGLNERQLLAAGISYHATITHSGSHAGYYPGSSQISLKLLYAPDGHILGAQAVGADGVDKRIDVIATAIQGGLSAADLADLELAYAPPFGSAKDPVNIAGYVAGNVLAGTHKVIGWLALQGLLATGSDVQLIDVRTAAEFSIATIAGARNIPLDQLRGRLDEIDRHRPVVLFCQVGMRGYLAQRILLQSGFSDVRNLTGGYKSYAFATGPQDNPDIFDYESCKPGAVSAAATAAAQPDGCQALDATGLQCPGPILKTFQAMQAMAPGESLRITATDPAFGRDVRAWAQKTGNDVLSVVADGGQVTAVLRKTGVAPVADGAREVGHRTDRFTMVVFSGDLDKVMAALIIASGAMAMGKKVSLFFTFWGLNVLRRAAAPRVKKTLIEWAFGFLLPRGAARLSSLSKMNFAGLGAPLMKHVMAGKHVDTPADLLAGLIAGGTEIIACQMSMDVMGFHPSELIDGVESGGVAAFLANAEESGTTLFI
ncbi:MAG: FAD-dependent oxidoreductase [Rhizomicrobium sp.]